MQHMITLRDVKIAISRNESMEDLCLKYNMSDTDLRMAIKAAVGGNQQKADGIIADIKKSAEKQRRKSRKETKLSEQQDCSQNHNQDHDFNIVVEEPVEKNAKVEVELLKEERDEKSNFICKLEVDFYKYRDKRIDIQKILRQLQSEMTNLAATYSDKQELFEVKLAEFNSLKEPMTEISEAHLAAQKELEVLDKKIQELQRTNILIIDDELVAEKEGFVADTSGSECIYRELLERDEKEFDLKKSQLMLLSRIIASKRNEPNIVFEFDSSELENAYNFFFAKQ